MPQNGINHGGVAALATSFKSNKGLKVCNCLQLFIVDMFNVMKVQYINVLTLKFASRLFFVNLRKDRISCAV